MDEIITQSSKLVVSLALLVAGSLLVGFSMGRWLAPLALGARPMLNDTPLGKGGMATHIQVGWIRIAKGHGVLRSLRRQPYLAETK